MARVPLGVRSKWFRLAKGLTQEEAGKMFGTTKANIANFETGVTKSAKVFYGQTDEEYYDVPPDISLL